MSVRNADTFPADDVTAGTATRRQVLIGPDQGPNFAMRRFIMQPGGGMPMHTNEVEHEQYVLRGSAEIRIGDETHHVKAGDVVYHPLRGSAQLRGRRGRRAVRVPVRGAQPARPDTPGRLLSGCSGIGSG